MLRSTTSPARAGRRWRPSFVLILTAVLAVIGAAVLTYSPAASWFSDYNQSLVISEYSDSIKDADPSASEQLQQAKTYNDALSAGALIEANTNIPTGAGTTSDEELDYWKMLRTPTDAMARVQVPKVDIDLPVYHGTSETALLRGAGHLQGTSLPVGGKDTHSVITAHRGLADSTMFTDLDKIGVGDRFIITTFGKVLTYQIIDTKVVDPSDNTSLRQEAGRDLVTLVTCTPLGINTHRILVTGKRITPTPDVDLQAAKKTAATLSFPWWAVGFLGALVLIGLYTWWGGRQRAVAHTPGAGSPRTPAGAAARGAVAGSGPGREPREGRTQKRGRRVSAHRHAGGAAHEVCRAGDVISYTFTATRVGPARPMDIAPGGVLSPLTYRWGRAEGTLQPGEQVTAYTGDPLYPSGTTGVLLSAGFLFTVTNTGQTTMYDVDIARGLPGLDALTCDWGAALAPLVPGQTATAEVRHRLTDADLRAYAAAGLVEAPTEAVKRRGRLRRTPRGRSPRGRVGRR